MLVYWLAVVGGMDMPWYMCGGWMIMHNDQFFITMWDMETELRSSGVVASSFIHWVILLALNYLSWDKSRNFDQLQKLSRSQVAKVIQFFSTIT